MNRRVRTMVLAMVAYSLACASAQDAQPPAQSQRLSSPRNSASQRYEINQTFGGQAYAKEEDVWVDGKDFK